MLGALHQVVNISGTGINTTYISPTYKQTIIVSIRQNTLIFYNFTLSILENPESEVTFFHINSSEGILYLCDLCIHMNINTAEFPVYFIDFLVGLIDITTVTFEDSLFSFSYIYSSSEDFTTSVSIHDSSFRNLSQILGNPIVFSGVSFFHFHLDNTTFSSLSSSFTSRASLHGGLFSLELEADNVFFVNFTENLFVNVGFAEDYAGCGSVCCVSGVNPIIEFQGNTFVNISSSFNGTVFVYKLIPFSIFDDDSFVLFDGCSFAGCSSLFGGALYFGNV
jgi:hypothetical protein